MLLPCVHRHVVQCLVACLLTTLMSYHHSFNHATLPPLVHCARYCWRWTPHHDAAHAPPAVQPTLATRLLRETQAHGEHAACVAAPEARARGPYGRVAAPDGCAHPG